MTTTPTQEEIKPGAVIEIGHPFIRETVNGHWTDHKDQETWRPGIRHEVVGCYGDSESVADAIGSQILTVISLHKPGRYPERVFYTRKWRDPDGTEFGRSALRITTAAAFRVMIRGYRWPFVMADTREDPRAITHEAAE